MMQIGISAILALMNYSFTIVRRGARLGAEWHVQHVDDHGFTTVAGLDGQVYMARDCVGAADCHGVRITRVLAA